MVLLLNTQLVVCESPCVCDIRGCHMKVSVRSNLICSSGTRTFWIQATVDGPPIHRVDSCDGGRSLKLVWIQAQLNLLDLIKVEHGCVLVPNLRLWHVIAGDIWPTETISRQIN